MHAGDLFLAPFFNQLGLRDICDKIANRGKFKFDLGDILAKLVYGRVLFPDSKLSTWKNAQNFIKEPVFELEDIYRALSVFARESDFIQASIYRNSLKTWNRDTLVGLTICCIAGCLCMVCALNPTLMTGLSWSEMG